MLNSEIELFLRGLLLCLLTAMALILLRRTAAAYRHLICVLALFGLLMLPLMQRFMPPLRLLSPITPATRNQSKVPHSDAGVLSGLNSKAEAPPMQDMVQKPIDAPPTLIPGESGTDHLAVAAHDPRRTGSTAPVLLTIWGLGVVTLLIRLIVALLRLRRLEAESRKATIGSVPVLISEQVNTPVTWGIRRSIILLPVGLISGGQAACDIALRHEQAHIARWDWMWNLLAELVCAFCWYQPGAWWLRSRMRLESERACDDRVLLSGVTGADYAAHLVAILRSACTSEVAPAMAQSGGMEERMKHILDAAKPRSAQTKWLAVTAPVALALLSIAALRVSSRPAEAKRQSTNETGKVNASVLGSPQSDSAGSADQPASPTGSEARQGSISPEIKMERVAWGNERNGVQLGLRLPEGVSTFSTLSAAKFEVLLRNRSGRRIEYRWMGYPTIEQFSPDLSTAKGKPIQYIRTIAGPYMDQETNLAAGETVVIGTISLPRDEASTLDPFPVGVYRAAFELGGTLQHQSNSTIASHIEFTVTHADSAPAIKLENVIWGKAVDGLEPGFLLTTPALPNNHRVPLNSQVNYRVLVRNTTNRVRYFELRCVNSNDLDVPYLIPGDSIAEALSSHEIPEIYRAANVEELFEAPPGCDMKLEPGETVVVPRDLGLYIGTADKGSYPRMDSVKAGTNWIVQPISVHPLTAEEVARVESINKTHSSDQSVVTTIRRDGKTGQTTVWPVDAQPGGTQLLAKIEIRI